MMKRLTLWGALCMSAIIFGKTTWVFPIEPESLEITYPARVQAYQTINSAYVDLFGAGIQTIRISATTGWGVGEQKKRPNGARAAATLISLYETWLKRATESPNPDRIPMIFVDSVNAKTYQVMPDASGLTPSQSKTSPLLVRFSLSLNVIRSLTGGATSAGFTVGSILGSIVPNAAQPILAAAGAALAGSPNQPPQTRYEVQAGDTLASIAQTLGVSVDALMQANGIRYQDRVPEGLVLIIPGGS